MAKDFSNPKKLGFMRVLQFFFAFNVIVTISLLAFLIKGSYELAKDLDCYQPRTWAFWRNIIIYFCVFSVVGHWMEAAYCTLIRFGMIPGTYDPNSQIWSDWLYPFIVYGFGAVACVLLLYPVKNFLEKRIRSRVVPLLISFVVNALVCTTIELVMGLMVNQPGPDGKLPLWDYPICSATSWARCVCRTPSPSAWWPRS